VASSAIVNMMGHPIDVTKFGIDLSVSFFQQPIVSFVILIEVACLKQETLKPIGRNIKPMVCWMARKISAYPINTSKDIGSNYSYRHQVGRSY